VSEKQQDGAAVPWPALLVLLGLAGGAFWYLAPLTSSRPRELEGPAITSLGEQHVDARLWQDPLSASEVHQQHAAPNGTFATTQEAKAHDVEALITGLDDAKNALIIPVFLPSGAYADQVEGRLRIRQAVLAGLAVAGFTPTDQEHIGYVMLDWPWNQKAVTQPTTQGVSRLLMPYEWCDARYKNVALTSEKRFGCVLILWLRENAFGDLPFTRLLRLLENLQVEQRGREVRVIGPRSSTLLPKMLDEASKSKIKPIPAFKTVTFYSPTSTAWDKLLQYNSKSNWTSSGGVTKALEEVLGAGHFFRSVVTDDVVADELIEELRRRHIDCGIRSHHIALIGEWDSFYGRALPLTFAARAIIAKERVRGRNPDEGQVLADLIEDPAKWPNWIHQFSYLRGLDGFIPGEGALKKEQPKPTDQQKQSARPMEQTEGLDQSDYVRRVAASLIDLQDRLDRQPKRDSSQLEDYPKPNELPFGELKAVGVLGSDVYDKLLILKALRKHLPGVVFFTNDLDARMTLPQEWDECHNLVVGSPYGLALADRFQKMIPPFRDSNQTAVFAGTLMALKVVPTGIELRPPRLFEISRTGAFNLSIDPWTEQKRLALQAASQPEERVVYESSMGPRTKSVWGPNIHPGIATAGSWWTQDRNTSMWWCVLLSVLLVGWTLLLSNSVSRFRLLRPLSLTSVFVILFGPLVFLFVWKSYLAHADGGEPFTLFKGISLWPTEIVRILAGLLCLHFIIKATVELRVNNHDLAEAFGLPKHVGKNFPAREWFKYWLKSLRFARWEVACDKAGKPVISPGYDKSFAREGIYVHAERLWEEYRWRGRFGHRLIRFFLPAMLFFLLGLVLMRIFGTTPKPGRGDYSFAFDANVMRGFTVPAMILLTFYVVDAMRLNEVFVWHLSLGRTHWPAASLEGCRQSRNLTSDDDLAEYMDMQMLARRTAVVGKMIYYPFVILLLLILSRVSWFDNWNWPAGLLVVLGLTCTYAIFSAHTLRAAAEGARAKALRRLRDDLVSCIGAGANQKPRADALKEIIEEIETLSEGAFAPISKQPLIGALLLPSGGLGMLAVLEYVSNMI
jgi:hypothetical protein